MLVARFEMDEEKRSACLRLQGHAQAGKAGQDIICAGASMMAYELAQCLKVMRERGLLRYEPVCKMREGNTLISCKAKESGWAETLVHFLHTQTGFYLLAHHYPSFVAVEMLGNDEEEEEEDVQS